MRIASASFLSLLVACGGSSSPGPAPSPSPSAGRVNANATANVNADPNANAKARPSAPVPAPAPLDLAAQLEPLAIAAEDACLVVRDPDGTQRVTDERVCAVRLRPQSTFKIANALIGADVGLITAPDSVLRYDRKRYPAQRGWREGWAQDQPLDVALRLSAVPLFRLLALSIGADRMQAGLDALHYGNHTIAGGLDHFWLDGELAISAPEQVDHVAGLAAGTLAVSARAQDIVRAALPAERAAGATLHWKTGTGGLPGGAGVGWLVGWVDRADGVHAFACWIRVRDVAFERVAEHRLTVCRGALASLGLFPATPSP
jgi:beta-lactamase class D